MEKRTKKRKREDAELEQVKSEETCPKCGVTTIEDVITIENPELRKKMRWEYDMEKDHLSAGGTGGIKIEVLPVPAVQTP